MLERFFNKEKKSVPFISSLTETTREGLNKAYIPKFLFKPPFGYPRFANLPYIRYLSQTPYVDMCISTILNELCAIKWDIIPNPDFPEEMFKEGDDLKDQVKKEIHHIKSFLTNPNTNNESFNDVFIKMATRDVLEVNSGVINKVYNFRGDLVEIVARAGDTFTKNPDIHGMFTTREDLLIPKKIMDSDQAPLTNPFLEIPPSMARHRAAYFQYGWIAGPMPIPFGRKEIIWLQDMIRSDDIYGYSPVQVLAKSLQMLLYHIESDLDYFNDNNVPKGIVGLDGSDAEEIMSFKKQWKDAQYKKDDFGNLKKAMHQVPIVNYDPKFTRIEFTSQEIELIEKQKWYSKMVWAAFGVTATELGYSEDATGASNQIVQSKVFRKKAINPKLRMLEDHINKQILTDFGYTDTLMGLDTNKYVFKYMTFDIDEERNKFELYKLQTESGIKTINEVRSEEGLEPVEWGEQPPSQWMTPETSFNMNNYQDRSDNANNTDENASKQKQTNRPDDNKKKVETETRDKVKKKSNDSELKIILDNLLKENEQTLKSMIEKELKPEVINQIKSQSGIEIKSVESIITFLKSILTVEGIKGVVNTLIQREFISSGKDASEKIHDINDMFMFVPDKDQMDFIANYTFDNIKDMTDEVANDLRREFKEGIMNGEGAAKLKNRVTNIFKTASNRSEMIARTETMRARQFGELNAWEQSGIKAKKWLMWKLDNRTSDITKELHRKYGSPEQAIPLEENFKATVKTSKNRTKVIDQPCGPFHISERDALMIEPV